MMTNPCPHCRRLSCKAGLTLVMLGLTLALCALLIGCASPCRPTLDPTRSPIRVGSLDGVIGSVGMRCEFRY